MFAFVLYYHSLLMQTYYSYDNVKFWFLPTSSHLLPLYLNTNKSPLAAVVVNVGAVSSLNSYVAFHVSVLEPVPSCITVKATTAAKGNLFVFKYNGSKWLEVGRNQNLTLS